MPKKIPYRIHDDLTGNNFGRLRVISFNGMSRQGSMWRCRCSCGNFSVVLVYRLKNGTTRSCGCINRDLQRSKVVDLVGKKFCRWTVISRAASIGKKGVYWNCRCSCGRISVVYGSNLRRGLSKSCGCLSREMASLRIGPRPHSVKDLTGKTFGKLLVVEKVPKRRLRSHEQWWKCLCTCGNNTFLPASSLKSGNSKSCGCGQLQFQLSRSMAAGTIFQSGDRFGSLEVISAATKGCGRKYRCLCLCGAITIVGATKLRDGKTKSCGCERFECATDDAQLVRDVNDKILKSNPNAVIPKSNYKQVARILRHGLVGTFTHHSSYQKT